jgi:Uma2 family endonuclease
MIATTSAVSLDPDKLYEMVDGQPEEKEMPGARHGGVCGRLALALGMYLKANQAGKLYIEASFALGKNEGYRRSGSSRRSIAP